MWLTWLSVVSSQISSQISFTDSILWTFSVKCTAQNTLHFEKLQTESNKCLLEVNNSCIMKIRWFKQNVCSVDLGCVQTWCPSTVPEIDSWWVLIWTHLFFMYPRQNSGTVPVPQSTLYSPGTELGPNISGTQCLNTAPFCAGARVLVLGHQVWTQP